jgi:adenylate kinase
MIIVFLGIQGSGKGTQAQLLCQTKGYTHVNLGELFRGHIINQTNIGQQAQSYLSQGLLVPDEIVFEVISGAIHTKDIGIVLDGFPRTLAQAHFLCDKYHISKVIYLELSDAIAKDRMLARRLCTQCKKDYNINYHRPIVEGVCDDCGGTVICRADDTPELIDNRIALFHHETMPLKDYYESRGKLSVVNTDADIDVIQSNILRALES